MRRSTQPHAITQMMFSALEAINPQCAAAFNQYYRQPESDSVYTHIEHANTFWRLQLGNHPISTTDIRECLLDNCSAEDWIRLFRTKVAPAAASLGLPMAQ